MKENFDDILKRKWEQKQFPVDDGHRKEMLELLGRKDRKRFFPFWWIGGLVVVTALSGYFAMEKLAMPDSAIPTQAPVISKTESKSDAGELPSSTSPVSGSIETTANTHQTDASQPSSVSAISNATDHASHTLSNTTGPSPVSPLKTTPGKTTKVSNTHQSLPVTKPVVKPDQANANTLPADVPAISSDIGISSSVSTVIQPTPVAVTEEKSMIPSDEPMPVESATLGTTETAREELLIPTLENLQPAMLATPSSPQPSVTAPIIRYKPNLSLFGEAGMGWVLGSQPDYEAGWKFRAGGGVGYTLHPRLQLNLSLGYLMQSGGFDFQRSSTVQQASFGARSSFNSLTPDRLHFVYTRVGGLYRVKRHFLALHGGVQYLYGAQGELVTHTVDQLTPGVTTTTDYDWVVTDGLQRWQWTADLAYGFQFTPKLSLMAGADLYFSQLTLEDEALTGDGYTWDGQLAPVHPFVTINYLIHAIR